MLTEAIWYMLTRNQAFAPASPLPALWPPDDPCLNWASRCLPIDLLHPGGGKEKSPLIGQTTPVPPLRPAPLHRERWATAWSYRSELSVRAAISLSEK